MRNGGRPRWLAPSPPDEGAAAVEFALVSVLLFTILFGILQYGFFFYQLSVAEYALGTAARQVELGQVDDCSAWEADATSVDGLGTGTEASWTSAVTGRPVQRGDVLTVSITWTPVRIDGGLVPFVGDERTTSHDIVVDRRGSTAIWVGPGPLGCP